MYWNDHRWAPQHTFLDHQSQLTTKDNDAHDSAWNGKTRPKKIRISCIYRDTDVRFLITRSTIFLPGYFNVLLAPYAIPVNYQKQYNHCMMWDKYSLDWWVLWNSSIVKYRERSSDSTSWPYSSSWLACHTMFIGIISRIKSTFLQLF